VTPKGKRDFLAFTVTHKRKVAVLQSPVEISEAFDPAKTPKADRPSYEKFTAIWDTGATSTVVSRDVVRRCSLKPVSMTRVRHVNGESKAEVFLVNIKLPNNVAIFNAKAVAGDIGGAEVLIGMDIITAGDFAVTNKDGKTTFSFRMPPIEHIDYVKKHKRTTSQPSRNAPCACGSGKKYKNCCGK